MKVHPMGGEFFHSDRETDVRMDGRTDGHTWRS